MKELQVIRHGEVEVVDSRDVARMVERHHNELMKTIRSYCEYLGQGDFAQSDFFIPYTYINSQNKEMPCYLLTKKGCDMVANKMTGEKGVLFTAAYVTAFEKMRGHIQQENMQKSVPQADHKQLSFSRASLIWEMAGANPIPEYKQICAHYASAELNSGVAFLPLPPVVEKTYTAKEVGEMLGGISANMVGRMANKNGMKTPEYGQEVWDKSPHSSKQVSSWRYNEKAVEELKKLFAERSKTRTEPLST